MKIIYYNKSIHINQNNISAYHLLLLSLDKLNISNKNIKQFYLTSLEGHPLNPSSITNSKKTYHLKAKLNGSTSIFQKENSKPLISITCWSFAIISIVYYWVYIRVLAVKIHPSVKARLNAFSIINMNKHKELIGGENNQTFLQKASELLKKIGFWICNNLQDSSLGIYFCYTRGVTPSFATKEDDSSFTSIITSTIFFTYMLIMFVSLFSNIGTYFVCKTPKIGFMMVAVLYLMIPMIIAIFIPKISEILDLIMTKFKLSPIFSNFKIMIANVFLLLFLFIYMIGNRKGISGGLWLALIPAILLFALFKIKIGSFSIDSIISAISKVISNFIFTNGKYSHVPDYPNGIKSRPMNKNFNPIPKDNKEKELLPLKNIRECFDRFEFIFLIIKSYIFYFIAFGIMTFVFANQIRKACPKK